MRWEKLGNLFCPKGDVAWMHSHAALPIAEHISGDLFRVYFSSRDTSSRSYTGYVLLDMSEPMRILEVSQVPVLTPGSLGEFDDSGAMASWLTVSDNTRSLYYIGWNLGVTVPFRNSIGVATANLSGPFVRYAPGPIVDRSVAEPHFTASCCVLQDRGEWTMWYTSCTGWTHFEGRPRHHYHIKYAESDDGIYWRRNGCVAIDFADENEYAISRPSVIREENFWRMWYSYRGENYRIGYAESEDGKMWVRRDHLSGISQSSAGWDSEMIEYPYVFDHKERRFMLYNGNDYGRSGFGIAVLEG